MNYTKYLCSILLLGVLTACGGGGSSDSNTPSTDPTSSGPPGNSNTPNIPNTPNNPDNPNIPNVPGNIDPQVPNLPVTANDIVDSSGAVVQSAYNAMALKLNTPEGIAYRYGAPYSGTDTSPTLYQPTDKLAQHFGAPDVHWQFGGPLTQDGGDYANTQAQALFQSDNPSLHFGVTDINTLGVGNNGYFEKPELPWQYYGGGLNEVNMVEYKASGLDVQDPYAVGRCYGRTGWCTTSLTAFKNGLVATSGTNTSRNRTTMQLAPGKIPTGVAVTTSSEFALISVWDTVHFKGQIAVVALAGLCDGCKPEKPDDANARMLLHKSALPKTTAPSQYHWLMAMSEKVPQLPKWRAHLEEYMPMVQSLQLTPAAGARAIQQLWLQRQLGADASPSTDTESFALPDLDAVLK